MKVAINLDLLPSAEKAFAIVANKENMTAEEFLASWIEDRLCDDEFYNWQTEILKEAGLEAEYDKELNANL